jgi:hypothetical protein
VVVYPVPGFVIWIEDIPVKDCGISSSCAVLITPVISNTVNWVEVNLLVNVPRWSGTLYLIV